MEDNRLERVVECKHCGGDVAIRNPKGFCDHLYYPEMCDVCRGPKKPTVAELQQENAALQSQITALKEANLTLIQARGKHDSVVVADLQAQLTAIKELINGASLHPETGVSLVDDVRDLVKENNRLEADVYGYKAQVAGQAKYIGHLLTEIADLKERIAEFIK